MSKRLRAVYSEALDLARATWGDVAEALGAGYRTLQAYRSGERRVTPAAARRLAAYLRDRARAFNKAAQRLEAAARREDE